MKLRLKLGFSAVFCAILCTTTAWGTDNFYASLTTKVANTGGGRVYASTSSQAGNDSDYTSASSGSSIKGESDSSGGDVQLYAHEKPNSGYRFLGWSESALVGSAIVSTNQHYGTSYTASTTKNGTIDIFSHI